MAKKSKGGGSRGKLRAFFETNVGKIVTSIQLREAAGSDVSEWARRVRELRNEVGMQILTHNDRSDLKPNEYILETLKLQPVIARGISRQAAAADIGTQWIHMPGSVARQPARNLVVNLPKNVACK